MRCLLYQFLLVLSFVTCSAGAQIHTTPENQSRLLFLAAEKALKNDDLKTYTLISNQLKDYPLISYLEYQNIKKEIQLGYQDPTQGLPYPKLLSAQHTFAHSPLWLFVLNRWLAIEAKHQRWDSFTKGYALKKETIPTNEVSCHAQFALYHTTGNLNPLKEALPLWLVGYSQPASCDDLFEQMLTHKIIKPHHIAQRFYLASEQKNFNLAQYLIKLMPNTDKNVFKTWLNIAKNPDLLKKNQLQQSINKSIYKNKIYQNLFYHLSRKDALISRDLFSKIGPSLPIKETIKIEITQDIAIRLSHLKDPSALIWLSSIPPSHLNPVASEWLVRLNLKDKNWPKVIEIIDSIDPIISSKSAWQYWKARAFLALNEAPKGLAILNELATHRHYYGFLASEHLKKPHTLGHAPLMLDVNLLNKMVQEPLFAKVEELMILHRRLSAKREWYHYLKQLNDDEKLYAAKIAHSKGWHDLAIMTLSNSTQKNDLSIRFPQGYKETIQKYALKNNIDEAWVYALTRQESAFNAKVRSPVGATGLMQLMPSTAQYVAKKNQLPNPSIYSLTLPETNIELGTKYLGSLQESFNGQMILATASYNAGINRIIGWLPQEPTDSDIWIENVPYHETRHYIKNILTYMGIYKSMMGESFRLSSVMKPVSKENEGSKKP